MNNTERQEIVYREILRMLMPDNLKSNIAHLDVMLDFYYKIIVNLFNATFKYQFQAEMSHSVQMMFTKAKSFRVLLDGVSHKSLKPLVDHTALFTIARSAYELLFSFELVYIIPDTDEKRLVMRDAYIAASAVNRQKIAENNQAMQNDQLEKEDKATIEACKKEIEKTSFFQTLSNKKRHELEKHLFDKGNYQFIIDKNGETFIHVGWDEIRKYCGLDSDILNGLYKYLCNMSHPSYMSLVQFMNAYKNGDIYDMADYATMTMNIILSVFIVDYMHVFPEAKCVFESKDEDTRFKIRMYCDYFRGKCQNVL